MCHEPQHGIKVFVLRALKVQILENQVFAFLSHNNVILERFQSVTVQFLCGEIKLFLRLFRICII